MKTLLKIAWRNVMRHKRRTVITSLVMSVGIGIYIFFNSVLIGMDSLTINNMIDLNESSVKVRDPRYADDPNGSPFEYVLEEPEALASRIMAADRRILAVAPRVKAFATLSNYRDELPVLMTVVDPGLDATVFTTSSYVKQGSWLDGRRNGVVIGESLARELGLSIGDPVLISANTVFENINADEYTVTGFINTPDPTLNSGGLIMAFSDAATLLGSERIITELNCKMDQAATLAETIRNTKDAATALRSSLTGMDVADIESMAQGYLAMRNMKSKYSMIIIFIVLAIAGVGIVNTILMSVFSRVKEIGVLRAYGMTPPDIQWLFIAEGMMIGLIGSVAGALFGSLLTWYMVEIGMPLEALIGKVDMGGLPIGGKLYGEWSIQTIVTGLVFGILVSMVSAAIPARMASKMKPSVAMKFI